MGDLQVQLLGEFQLCSEGATIRPFNQPRLQSLIAYLLLHRNTPQLRQRLAFLFWPDSNEAQARTNLRKQLLLLRRAWPEVDYYLSINTKVIQWQPDAHVTLDVSEFEHAAAQSAGLMGDLAIGTLERVAGLYRGDLLPGCYDSWLIAKREQLHASYLRILEQLVLVQEDARDYSAAIRVAEQFVRHDPSHETTYRRLMRLHALNGDRAAALQVYQRCVTILERELGVEPSIDTRTAYARLLQDELPAVLRARLASPLAAQPPFIGRQFEWRALQAVSRTSLRGHAHVVFIAGEAGIGKTRLAEELLSWAANQGMTTAHARSYASEGRLAYAPLIEWLRPRHLKQV